jgi:hypothetical protein
MTTIDTPDRGTLPATLESFLVPISEGLTTKVGKAVSHAPQRQARGKAALMRTSAAIRKTVAAEVLQELRKVLGEDVVNLFVEGVTRHTALRDAARASLVERREVPVKLARHVVHRKHTVEVRVTGPAFRIDLPFDIDVAFDVLQAEGTVKEGRLRTFTLPDPSVTGTVDVHHQEVFRQSGTWRAGRSLTLDDGFRILSEQEERTARGESAT